MLAGRNPRPASFCPGLHLGRPSSRVRWPLLPCLSAQAQGPHPVRLTVDLSVNDYDRELFAERKLVFEQREGEGLVHVILKVLAFALYFDPKLVVEPSFEDEYKPDLLIRADDYRPALWVEC